MLVDLVYLWCDGNDPEWKKKKESFIDYKIVDKHSIQNCRFVQSDELKYSLRSVEQYAPWINKIYIVTDNQIPKWLNLNNDRIKIIDHKDIMPADALPTFNSTAIETCLPFIENLSEYFLFANDDMFLWNKVSIKDFYETDGKPICYLRQKIKNKKYKHQYGHTVKNAYEKVKEKYYIEEPYFPHHNIDAYRKSYFIDCIKEFQEDFKQTTYRKFRSFDDVQRSIVTYYMIAKYNAKAVHVEKPWYNPFFREESGYVKFIKSKIKNIENKNYKFLCINDTDKSTDDDREYMKNFLERKFPKKSQYEIY